ncbi:hypothetical protein MRB53_025375 [Persea americana]|uniref:Uncharacterized protein n=1 Tax=Persea americana TaxID=3435 RepID=A0ACC2LG83_PERAE|nr:hypothetical protein MRB53_025375 [Persea americana]
MVMLKLFCWKHLILYISLLLVTASAKDHGNPATKLVDYINENRTSNKLSKLQDSPGLGCMALQYIEECKGNCSANGTVNCHPPEEDITEVYAPNCGVELPTVDIISGRIVSGQTNSTFVLEGGTGIKQKRGCFSGMDTPCSEGQKAVVFHGFCFSLHFSIFRRRKVILVSVGFIISSSVTVLPVVVKAANYVAISVSPEY